MSENEQSLRPQQPQAPELPKAVTENENAQPAAHPAHEPQPKPQAAAAPRLDAFYSIPVTLELVLKSLKLPVSKLMELQEGSEIDLDHPAGSEVALVVNGSRIAFGHLFLIDQQSRRVGVRVSRLAASGGDV